jgi:hypothetical protein
MMLQMALHSSVHPVSIAPARDTNNINGVLTDDSGNFEIGNLSKGTYMIRVTYVGYERLVRYLRMDSVNKNIGSLKLRSESEMLKSVTVTARAESCTDEKRYCRVQCADLQNKP